MRGSECPPDSEWPLVAAGLKEMQRAEVLLRHAAACDHCGPLLRQAVEDFSDDLTAEEETMLTRLETSQPGWQERMAREARQIFTQASKRIPLPTWVLWLMVGCAVWFAPMAWSQPTNIFSIAAATFLVASTVLLLIARLLGKR
jgi:hypothetical protein